MSLEIQTHFDEQKSFWMVDVMGEIDIYTANKLKETFYKLLEIHNENIKINCSELDYIDSTGLGVLIGVLKKLKESKKEIMILNPKSNISKLLNITGLNKIFIIEGE